MNALDSRVISIGELKPEHYQNGNKYEPNLRIGSLSQLT